MVEDPPSDCISGDLQGLALSTDSSWCKSLCKGIYFPSWKTGVRHAFREKLVRTPALEEEDLVEKTDTCPSMHPRTHPCTPASLHPPTRPSIHPQHSAVNAQTVAWERFLYYFAFRLFCSFSLRAQRSWLLTQPRLGPFTEDMKMKLLLLAGAVTGNSEISG